MFEGRLALITFPHDQNRSLLVILIFVRTTFIPAAVLIGFWLLTQILNAGVVADVQTGGVTYVAHISGSVFGLLTARWSKDPQRLCEQEESGSW